MKSRLWTAIWASFGMCILILDAKTALTGAADGISLCIRSVIPSLFPFFVLSMILTSTLWGTKVFRPLGKLCGIPAGGESLLIVGLLGGYPVGAQNVAEAWRSGALTRKDAQRLLGFCSNMGPAFIFGILSTQFDDWWAPWALWGIQILSSLTVGIFLPGRASGSIQLGSREPLNLTGAVKRGTVSMAAVCTWVVLFRIIIAFLQRWFGWLLRDDVTVIVSGILELTNGCCSLRGIADANLRFVAASGLCTFGGLCVTMQTASVAGELGIKPYLTGKALQTAISIALAYFVVEPKVEPLLLLAFLAIICREIKKRGRIPASIGV